MPKLPIGIQTFSIIREQGYAYVDKTPLIARLVEEGRYYFLSRPRRFGKSLLVDTLAEAFAGNRGLFTGLYLADHWDWQCRHPVVRLDLSVGVLRNRDELDTMVRSQLRRAFRAAGLSPAEESPALQLAELVQTLAERSGERVVVLIDEYDKPILDNLEAPERAREMREGLRNLYSVLKGLDTHLRFVFLTGVSKFSKVSLFSGLNNLKDITLDERFGTLCGYTQSELERTFADHLDGIDLAEMKRWYNGYSFLGESVYSPFDVLLHLDTRQHRSYWFETGTPTFLIDLLRRRRFPIPAIEHLEAGEHLIGSFDVDTIEPAALLFQTGYVTIHSVEMQGGRRKFRLGYPNLEVRMALTDAILTAYVPDQQRKEQTFDRVLAAIEAGAPDGLHQALRAFFDSIPHDWSVQGGTYAAGGQDARSGDRNNAIADYEGYYCAVVYCYLAALGLDVTAEDTSNQGRIDLSLRHAGRVWLLELKATGGDGSALAQIKARGYQRKYAGRECWLVGIEFDPAQRNIGRFEWERAG